MMPKALRLDIIRSQYELADLKTCAQILPVCTENLNPDVVVMKSAKDRV